jgi:hypothetical protein
MAMKNSKNYIEISKINFAAAEVQTSVPGQMTDALTNSAMLGPHLEIQKGNKI